MDNKNGIWTLILKILVQILNFILSKLSRKKDGDKIEYKQDEQENKEMKDKLNNLIKDKIGKGDKKNND